jgi:DNA-binding transcriptional ArsR family regulator
MNMSTFEALADPSRRRVVEALRRGEQPVNDIVAALDIHQSGVSRHLRILLEAGFVKVRPEGQLRLYSLRPEPFREMDDWLGGFRRLWEGRLDRFAAALEAKRLERSQPKSNRKRKDS